MAGNGTLESRVPVAGGFALLLAAWSLVGIGTGHMYVQYGRAPPAHFSGWAAAALSVALFVLAIAVTLRLFDAVPRARGLSRLLLLVSCCFAALAIGMKLAWGLGDAPGRLGFEGLLGDGGLRQALDRPAMASFAARHMAGVFSWLKVSCACLLGVAAVCKLLGATKQSAEDHPAITGVLLLVFSSPFLAWLSLEFMGHAFQGLPLSVKAGEPWRAEVAFTLSMLVALAGAWMFAGIGAFFLAGRAFGVRVVWKRLDVPASPP